MTDWNWCRTCWYCGLPADESHATCDFLVRTGMTRGCAPGRTCTRYEPAQGHSRRDLWKHSMGFESGPKKPLPKKAEPPAKKTGPPKVRPPLEERMQELLDSGVRPEQTGLTGHEERLRAHACRRCGVRDARTLAGGQFCQACCATSQGRSIQDQIARNRAAKERWLAQGLCSRCGKTPPVPGGKMCSVCREKDMAYRARKRKEKKHE